MTQATLLWSIWQSLLQSFAWAFTRPGHRRFVEWVTALALNVEEHTITQSVTAIERMADWKAMETFAESGSWRADYVTSSLTRLIEKAPGRVWHGYHVSAVDDTKVHRSRRARLGHLHLPRIHRPLPQPGHPPSGLTTGSSWGPCSENPDQPAWFLPDLRAALLPQVAIAPSLPARRLPDENRSGPSASGPSSCSGSRPGWSKAGGTSAVFDGGFALRSVVRPLVDARGRLPPDRVPDQAAARRPAVRPAADDATGGAAGADAEVGQEAAAAPPGRALDEGGGRRGTPSSTGGGGRSSGRRSCACGGCRGIRSR